MIIAATGDSPSFFTATSRGMAVDRKFVKQTFKKRNLRRYRGNISVEYRWLFVSS